jgi:hypothetical protein
MNGVQIDKLQSILDKLRFMSYSVETDISYFPKQGTRVVFDLAASLQDLEAELLTIPNMKV